MQLKVSDITFCVQCNTEAYWIYYVLRDAVKVFDNIIVLDTGSEDNTVDIIKTAFPNIELIEEHYGNDAHKIGNGRNILREACKTYWEFLCDSDEIYREDQLHRLLEYEVPANTEVITVGRKQVQDVDGILMIRTNDVANCDRLFSPAVHWDKVEYPFESHDIDDRLARNVVHNIDVYHYHMRHTMRSDKGWSPYFRKEKADFFPYDGPFETMPEDWLGNINYDLSNPYFPYLVKEIML
jgi:glycosyltransferase involved in cell wall biosynthesis